MDYRVADGLYPTRHAALVALVQHYYMDFESLAASDPDEALADLRLEGWTYGFASKYGEVTDCELGEAIRDAIERAQNWLQN